MKTSLLGITLIWGLVAPQARAQGTVTFGNNSATAITNCLTLQRVVAGTTFLLGLYYLPDGPEPTREEMELLGIRLGANAAIQPAAGLYAAGTRTTPATTPGGGFAWFQVRGWESAFGTTYDQAKNAGPINGRYSLLGTSNIIRVKTGDPVNNIPPGALTAFGLQSFFMLQLECIPEPASFAIAALGLGALLLFRRRK
jgi:hypothetical protein